MLDTETGSPLHGATVFVPSVQRGTATDERGGFLLQLPRPGAYRMVVSFVGYRNESREVVVDADGLDVEIALDPIEVEVPGITVTARAQPSDILSTSQAVDILEGRDLRENRGVTLFDALAETAGVRTLTTGVGVAKPMIRGLTSQRVLVVQNGIRQEGQQWGDEHGPELDAFDVDRIEVVKGPASLLYGSDALGGVIQASSEDLFSHREPLSGAFSLQALSNPEMGASSLQLGGSSGANFYGGSFTWKRAASYETPTGVIPNTGLEEINGSLRLGRRYHRGTLLAEYQRFASTIAFFEPEEDHHEADGGFSIELPFQEVAHDKVRATADLRMDYGRLEAAASWQQNRRKEFEEHHEEDAGQPEVDPHEEPALFLRLNTLTADLRFHHRPMGRLYGTIGASGLFQKNETLAEETLIPGARTWNGGIYVYEELLLRGLTINGGLRFDARRLAVDRSRELDVQSQTRSYEAFTGALGVAWQPASSLSLALNAGRAWRAPALIELFGNGVHEGTIRFERGDPSLSPERSLSFDGTVRWLHPHIFVEAAGFVNQIYDYIFVQRTGEVDLESGYLVYEYRQAEARLWGGELRADVHPHPLEWLHFHLAADLTRTENLDANTPLPLTPPARLIVESALTSERIGRVEDIRVRFGPTIVARQNRIGPLEIPTDGYSIWNASLSGRIPVGRIILEPLIAVDNLLDEEYVDHLSRFRPFGILNPGRSIRFQLVTLF